MALVNLFPTENNDRSKLLEEIKKYLVVDQERSPSTMSPSGLSYLQRALALTQEQPDTASLQEYARARQAQGQQSMLNALAAGIAGPQYQGLQQGYLRRAMAAQEPEQVGSGIAYGGKYISDPYASRKEQIAALLNIGKETASDERAAARELEINRRYAAMLEQRNARPFGSGNTPQIGTDPKGIPVFKDLDTGKLFSYGTEGIPTLYTGPINPKTSVAQPSEDERKAAGWFAQADLAVRNMDEALKLDPTASQEPLTEVLTTNIPLVGDAITQSQRTPARQMFIQAAESMSEALLRAATGAGINEYEAKQKADELVPKYGDKLELIKQKRRGYDTYMASLRARAGRAMPALETALQDVYAGMSEANDDDVVDLPSPGSQ